jgi:hypothetical protein
MSMEAVRRATQAAGYRRISRAFKNRGETKSAALFADLAEQYEKLSGLYPLPATDKALRVRFYPDAPPTEPL